MKKILFERFGPAEKVANCVSVEAVPEPKDWEMTVDILAASINPSDISVVSGRYGKLPARLPATTGLEGAGQVVAVGAKLEGFKVGDRVLVLANENWVQRRNLTPRQVMLLPDWIDFEQASLIKVNAVCAYLLLKEMVSLKKGEYLLQNAPLSAVGRMVIGFAKHLGFRTVNVVRRESAISEVQEIGGDVALVESDELAQAVSNATGKARIRLALDAVAGQSVARMADCLDNNAVIVNYGMLSSEPCVLRADHTIFRNIRLQGFWLLKHLSTMKQKETNELFDEIFTLLEATRISSEVSAVYPIEQIADALAAAQESERRGKVILAPNGTDALA